MVVGPGGALESRCRVHVVNLARPIPDHAPARRAVRADFGVWAGLVSSGWSLRDRLHAWRVRRSFRHGPARTAVPGGRHVAGPQPNNVCSCQPWLVCSLSLALLERLQLKLVR